MAGPTSSALFVGREAELAALEEESSAVVIAGEAGVGKSRLVAELERRAQAAGRLVLIGECMQLTEGELAYAPVVAALRQVIHTPGVLEPLSTTEREELARLWPEPRGGADDRSNGGSQARLFGLLLGVLTRLAQDQPVVFVIEDLHWADRSTRDFVSFLVRAARGDRVLLIMTLRVEEMHPEHPAREFVAELSRVRGVRRLALAPFSPEELALQVQGILGERPPPGLVARLFERSAGNAFYTEELLAAGGGSELPTSLRDALLVRIERLSSSARTLLAVAACAERPLDERLLAAAAPMLAAEFETSLRETLTTRELVTTADGSYTFRHALVREAVYSDLLAGERARLHGALAKALGDHPELGAPGIGVSGELARHWHAAGSTVEAFEASVRASAEAERALAVAETLGHAERALELWDRVPDAAHRVVADRAALLARGAWGALQSDAPARAVELARAAIAELGPEGERARLVRLYLILGRGLWYLGDNTGTLAAYHEAVQLVPAHPPSTERALALAGEGQALMLAGYPSESRDRCEEALAMAHALGDRLVAAQVHNTLAGVGWWAGNPIEHADAGLRIALEIGAVDEIGRGYVNGSECLDYEGRIGDAIALADEGIADLTDRGLTAFVAYLTSNLAHYRVRLGEFEAAELLCAEPIPQMGQAAALRHRAIGMLAMARSEFDEADAALTRAAELARGIGGAEWWPASLAALALLRLWQGRLEDAADIARQALDAVDEPSYAPALHYFVEVYPVAARIMADVAELARARGQTAAVDAGADLALAKLDAMLARIPADHQPPRPVACRMLTAAEASRARGRSDAAVWEMTVQRFGDLDEPYAVAYAQYRQAEAVLGSRGSAASLLRDAHSITTRIGERPLRAEIETLARRHRVALEEQHAADPAANLGITAREREVLELLAEGRTNREIADALVITEKTASVHVSHILAKLNASNRGEAAAIAHRLGLTAT